MVTPAGVVTLLRASLWLLSALGLWVKILDLMVSMSAELACVVTPLRAVSWSSGFLDLDGFFGTLGL